MWLSKTWSICKWWKTTVPTLQSLEEFRLALIPISRQQILATYITTVNMRRSDLHWLRVPERIVFKVAMLTFRALHGTAPPYLTSQFTRVLTCLTSEGCDLHRLISSTFLLPVCQLSGVVRFRLLVLRSGTAYQMMSPPLHPCSPSALSEDLLIKLLFNTD